MIRFSALRLFALVAVVLPLYAHGESAPKHRIGVIAPLTGGLASSGTSVAEAARLAAGRAGVEVVIEDDGFQPKNSVASAKKLIEADRVAALVVFGSPTSLAVAPVAEDAKVPMIAISLVLKVVEGRRFVVKHFATLDAIHKTISEEVQKRGYKRVAIVTTINDASLGLRDRFKSLSSVTIVSDQEFAKEDSDFATPVAKLRAANPDAIYLLLFAPQPSAFMKALRGAGVTTPVFAVHNVDDESQLKAAGTAFDGMWFVTQQEKDQGEFRRVFVAEYGHEPAMGGSNAYDAVLLLAAGFPQREPKQPLREYLRSVQDFTRVFGKYRATGQGDFEIETAVKSITCRPNCQVSDSTFTSER